MRPNMKRGSGRCDALHFCTIRQGAGLTKSIGEICRLKVRVDISGDRLPISDSNGIIIIQNKSHCPRAWSAPMLRAAPAPSPPLVLTDTAPNVAIKSRVGCSNAGPSLTIITSEQAGRASWTDCNFCFNSIIFRNKWTWLRCFSIW
jgi:hypothetical protein